MQRLMLSPEDQAREDAWAQARAECEVRGLAKRLNARQRKLFYAKVAERRGALAARNLELAVEKHVRKLYFQESGRQPR